MHDKVTALEEGLFGFANVKLGANAKERGIVVRNVHGFRRAVLTGVVLLALALGGVWLYWRRARHANTQLAASSVRQRSIECRAIVEGILLKQDEIDELSRRLRQRSILDNFLETERGLEVELKKRLLKLVADGPESQERKTELDGAMQQEMLWFKDAVGDAVERIIAPLDEAFKDIPRSIRNLQADIHSELPAFGLPANQGKTPMCENLPAAVAGAPWEKAFVDRVRLLVDVARNASSPHLDQDVLGKLSASANKSLAEQVPTSLVAMLLKWYSTASPDSLSDVLLQAQPALKVPPPVNMDMDDPEGEEEAADQEAADQEGERDSGPEDDDDDQDDQGEDRNDDNGDNPDEQEQADLG